MVPNRIAVSLRLACFIMFTMFAFTIVGMTASAQEFRGSITGQIVDSSGGAVPAAQITVTNRATNATTSAVTDEEGNYTALYLTPGQYTITVEGKGYKRLMREGVQVRVGDKLTLDMVLEIGELAETVSITSETPLLETASGSVGQVIDGRRISELPLSDGNPFALSRLAPGVAFTGDLRFSRPFDNGGTSGIVVAGSSGGNEFTLDGSPNQASGRRVAFVPPSDAVDEFKIETLTFDAQQGHTGGATVNVKLKSGTNDFHGTLYEFVRNDVISANDFFTNQAGKDTDGDGKADRSPVRYNRYGGTIGGPVYLPRFGEGGPALWRGRDRSFFFFAYEGFKDSFPEPGFFTVPTAAQRSGDFSALLGAQRRENNGALIFNRDGSPALAGQIYDPLTAVAVGGRIQRLPIQCNGRLNVICPERVSPISRNYLSYYPQPNVAGDSQGRNNFFSGNPRSDDFHSESIRLDHTLNNKHQFFARYSHNNRVESRGNYTDQVNGLRATGNFLFRINHSLNYDHIYTMTPTTVLNVRAGFSRFDEPSRPQNEGFFNPAALGFSSRTTAFFGDAAYLPPFNIGNFSGLGANAGGGSNFNIYSVQPTLTKITGDHSLRFGYDFRAYRENGYGPGALAGSYNFGTDFTRQTDQGGSASPIGQELAAFLLGQPTGGSIDRNTARSNQTLYHGIFFQDDWKVSRRLTLNLGLRYEYEPATTERYNRNIRGFDETAALPIESAARAAYAANPVPQIAPNSFSVRGGLRFADENSRAFFNPDKNNFQPRIGFAYQVSDKTVVRGGWANYAVPFIIDAVNQSGFSQATGIVPTSDNGLSFRANLFDPFPDGILQPVGSSLGAATNLGRGISFVPVERKNGQVQRFGVGVQHELPGQWLIEMYYIGSIVNDLTVGTDLNPIPRQYLSTSPVRDTTVINLLQANVINPFRNLLPGTGLNGSTVQRQQLLRPFPQFISVGSQRYDGSSIYHSGQFRAERRFTKGYTLLANYTWSKLIEEVSLLNATDPELERRISGNDSPHILSLSGIYELPFGKGRRFGGESGRWADALIGGWQVQGIWTYQSGRPIGLGNLYNSGDLRDLRFGLSSGVFEPRSAGNPRSLTETAFDTSLFYFTDAQVRDAQGNLSQALQRDDPRIRLENNIRTLPTFLTNFRGQPLNLWDASVIKHFSLTETVRLQLRGELLNALNHAQFNNPNIDPRSSNFGKISSQANLPRNIQLGIKLVF